MRRKRRTYISGIYQRMLPDDTFKYSSQLAFHHWLWENTGSLDLSFNKTSLSEYLLEYSKSVLPKKYEKIYRLASKPNKYIYGLPVTSISTNKNQSIINTAIEYLKKQYKDLVVIDSFIDEQDFYYTAWFRLIDELGYDSETNELKVLSKDKGFACYLYDGYLALSEQTVNDYDEFDNTTLPFNYNYLIDRDLDIKRKQTVYQQSETDKLIVVYTDKESNHETYEIDLADINHISQDIPTVKEYVHITYKTGSGYQWFMYEIGSLTIPDIDYGYTTKILKGEYYPYLYIKHNYTELINHYDKQSKTDSIKLFKRIGLSLADTTTHLQSAIGGEYGNTNSLMLLPAINIKDSLSDGTLAKYCFNWFEYLYNQLDTSSDIHFSIQDNVSRHEVVFNKIIRQIHTTNNLSIGYHAEFNNDFIFYHKIADDLCVSYTIVNLTTKVHIANHLNTYNETNDYVMIPLERSIVKTLKPKEREYLFNKSLHLFMLHIKVVKQKWYETSLFKAVIIVIGIVITVINAPAGQGLMATMKALAISVVKGYAINVGLEALLKVAVKLGLNPNLVGAIAFVGSIVATSYGSSGTNVISATDIMRAVNNSFEVYGKYLNHQILEYQKQLQDLQADYVNKERQIKDTQRLLDTKVFTPSQELLTSSYTSSVNLYETLEMFYTRHQEYNVIGLSHALIDNFTEYNLNQKNRLYQPKSENVEDILLI